MKNNYWKRVFQKRTSLLSMIPILLLLPISITLFPRQGETKVSDLKLSEATLLTGAWRITLHTRDIGSIDTRIYFKSSTSNSFTAHSRPKALSDILGTPKAALARIFSANFKKGAFLHIQEGKVQKLDKGFHIEGKLWTPVFGHLDLEGSLQLVPQLRIEGVLRQKNTIWGFLEGKPDPGNGSLRDYSGLAEAIQRKLTDKIFRPTILTQARWRKFQKTLQRKFQSSQDDLDVLLTFYEAAKHVNTSHLGFYRQTNEEIFRNTQEKEETKRTPVKLSFPEEETALLRIEHFVDVAEEIQEAFRKLQTASAKSLILDLRGNPGGNLSSSLVAGHLLEKPTPAGFFVGNKWWEDHKELPIPEVNTDLPVFAGHDLKTFFAHLETHGGFFSIVSPQEPYFSGKVYILVDRMTASACEPLVHILQSQNRAVVLGEKTAGNMLSSEVFDLDNGWKLLLPTADYFTAEGKRLEGVGVLPDLPIDPKESMPKILQMLPEDSQEKN